MTKLVSWVALAGALVGIVVFGAECWSVHRELAGVVFDGGYEPM
ncbi:MULTISPECIES: hypothetical protein [unclassified Rhodococcus (in: high G+C Gram-positive bacteria)]|nr:MULTISPECIES: hypothetical protein [unclassified Rhodococcus (in: high G+C Gram-positive bacteria)]